MSLLDAQAPLAIARLKIVIPGGSGQVGTILARAFQREGHDVVVLSRRPEVCPWRVAQWDGVRLDTWQREMDGSDVVVNLAGRSVNCRYTPANGQEIMQSRVASTRAVGEAIARAARPPRVWIQASTATIYAHRFDRPNDEQSGVLGGAEDDAPRSWRFSTDVARAWEAAFDEAAVLSTRKVTMRSAITMSPDAGGRSPFCSHWSAAAWAARPETGGNSCRGSITQISWPRCAGSSIARTSTAS